MNDLARVAGGVALVALLMMLVRGPAGRMLIDAGAKAWQRAAAATMWPRTI